MPKRPDRSGHPAACFADSGSAIPPNRSTAELDAMRIEDTLKAMAAVEAGDDGAKKLIRGRKSHRRELIDFILNDIERK